MSKAIVDKANELVRQIGPLLAGRGPQVQGAALADLVAMYFAGHNPSIRDEVMELWLATMRSLIPLNEVINEQAQVNKERRQ